MWAHGFGSSMRPLAVIFTLNAVLVGAAAAPSVGVGTQALYAFSNGCIGDVSLPETNSAIGITFRHAEVPIVGTVDLFFSSSTITRIGLTADWWIQNPVVFKDLHFFYGPGLACRLWTDTPAGYIGARFETGLNLFVIPHLELYLQGAAEFGPLIEKGRSSFAWSVPVSSGARWWF